MKRYASVVCALLAACALLILPVTAVGQGDPPPDPDPDMELPPPEPPEDPEDAIAATNQYLDEAMFMGEAAQICAEYHETNPPLEPEGIDKAMLQFFSRVMADVSGEEVDMASDPGAVASMRSFLITGLDCENESIFFDLGDYYTFDDAELENVEPPDDAFIEELRGMFFPSGTDPAMGEEGMPGEEGGDPTARTMGAAAGGGGDFDFVKACCVPLGEVEPLGGHPFTVECPPKSMPPAAAPYGNVVPDISRCWNGSTYPIWAEECTKKAPDAADLIGMAYTCQAGQVFQAQREVEFRRQLQSLGNMMYMLKPMVFGPLSGVAFALTAPATAGGVAVAGAIAVATAYAGTEGYTATVYGNAATSMVEGGNPLNPVSFVVPTLEKAFDAAYGETQKEALEMIGENAELAEIAEQDLLTQRRKLKELEQMFRQMGGKRPKLTDTACNNQDAWRWKK